jgi:hypothetical protein
LNINNNSTAIAFQYFFPVGRAPIFIVNETFVKTGLGALITIYSLYSLFGKTRPTLEEGPKVRLFVCGFRHFLGQSAITCAQAKPGKIKVLLLLPNTHFRHRPLKFAAMLAQDKRHIFAM